MICSAPFIYFSIVEKETHVLDNGSKQFPNFLSKEPTSKEAWNIKITGYVYQYLI